MIRLRATLRTGADSAQCQIRRECGVGLCSGMKFHRMCTLVGCSRRPAVCGCVHTRVQALLQQPGCKLEADCAGAAVKMAAVASYVCVCICRCGKSCVYAAQVLYMFVQNTDYFRDTIVHV
jgi:hypothetical protein